MCSIQKIIKPQILGIAIFLFCFQNVFSQKEFNVTIQFDTSFDLKSVKFNYDNGVKIYNVTDTFINNHISIKGKFYSPFACLSIIYFKNGEYSHSVPFFINEIPARVFVHQNNNPDSIDNPENYNLLQAININESNIDRERIKFIKEEGNAMSVFMENYGDKISTSDTINKMFKQQLKTLNDKSILFIKDHADDYFSLWYFRTQVINIALTITKDDSTKEYLKYLLNFFDTTFPSEYRETAEGEHIRNLLLGVIQPKFGNKAPGLNLNDINGKSLSLDQFKDRLVLLDFWASWCPPCMHEIPFFKEIRDKYPAEKLTIIGISSDTDSAQFINAINKNNMDWINVYGQNTINDIFGVGAIPRMFLINKEGVIVYDSNQEDDKEVLLKLIDELIENNN